ncbi:hypothetical protein GCM10020254_84490 [Streptomyces goshikiensis]
MRARMRIWSSLSTMYITRSWETGTYGGRDVVAGLFPQDVEEFDDAAGLAGSGVDGVGSVVGALCHAFSPSEGLRVGSGCRRARGRTSGAAVGHGRARLPAGMLQRCAVL